MSQGFMAKEATIKKNTIKILKSDGWLSWWPPAAVYTSRDIFGIADCIAIKGDELKFIQITSKGNVSARKKKIDKVFLDYDIYFAIEVWGNIRGTKFTKFKRNKNEWIQIQ